MFAETLEGRKKSIRMRRKESEQAEKRGRELRNRGSGWQRPLLEHMKTVIGIQRAWAGLSFVPPFNPQQPGPKNRLGQATSRQGRRDRGVILRWPLTPALTLTLTPTQYWVAKWDDLSKKPKAASSEGWECRLRNHKELTLHLSSASY